MAAIVNEDWKNLVQVGKYYQINNTKKVLYWDGTEWRQPMKDSRGSYGGYIGKLENQPKRIKTVTEVSPSVIGCL